MLIPPPMVATVPEGLKLVNEYLVPLSVMFGSLAVIGAGLRWFHLKVVKPKLDRVMDFVEQGREFFSTVNEPMAIPVSTTEVKPMRLREAFGHLARGQIDIMGGLEKSEAWRAEHDRKWPMGEVHISGTVTLDQHQPAALGE